jgi:N-acyl-D-aspartate/D-glutamate deacylase
MVGNMTYDLLIKDGIVIDGSGLPRSRADVAIKDGLIAEVGSVVEGARRVVEADGLVVAPGIVDAHTHYDAQVTWDPLATSSCFHGVTTVVGGNCGYTVAPCRPEDRDWLAKTFAAVEGIDLPALQAGLPWDWETYPEYINSLDGKLGLNFTGYVGHSAVRRYVMGAAANERAATPDEVERMRQVVRESLAAGAAGFSTSLSATQVGYYNEPIPSRLATDEEVYALAGVVKEFNAGNIAILPRSAIEGADQGAVADMVTRLARDTGRPVVAQTGNQAERAARAGVGIYTFQMARPFDRPFTLRRTTIFNGLPTWRRVLELPHVEKIQQLRDESIRVGLRHEVDHGNTDASKGQLLQPVPWHTVFVDRVRDPEHKRYEGKSLVELARAQGKHVADAFADLALAEDLETRFRYRQVWDAEQEERIGELLANPYTLVGTSDGGAHLDRDDGAEYSTYFIRHWVFEKRLFSLEEAVRRLTFIPASVVGLLDRGLLRPGYAADVAIFDPENLRLTGKDLVADLPGGGLRFVTTSSGVRMTIVNGEVLIEDGRPTGARPGRYLRCHRSNRVLVGASN